MAAHIVLHSGVPLGTHCVWHSLLGTLQHLIAMVIVFRIE